MGENKQARLAELRARLEELRKRDPFHCTDTGSYVPHTMPPSLFREIEDTEEQIRALEAE